MGNQLIVVEETSSTNDLAWEAAATGAAEGFVVFAERQTAGRGRYGRRWESAPYQGLWFSVLLHPPVTLNESPRLTSLLASVAAATIIDAKSSPAIKRIGNELDVPDLAELVAMPQSEMRGVIQAYNTVPSVPYRIVESALSSVARAADFHIVWGAAGAIDTVFDDTHGVPVSFSPSVGPTWGILRVASFAKVNAALTDDRNNAKLTWADAMCVAPLPRYTSLKGGKTTAHVCSGDTTSVGIDDSVAAQLQNSAALDPIAIRDSASSTIWPDTLTPPQIRRAGYTANGTGFIFYLAGHFTMMQMTALPAAGTVWHVRQYAGNVTGTAGSYKFVSAVRPPNVPGLKARVDFTGSTLSPATTTTANLAKVHTVPDPYYVTNALETTANNKVLQFVNLPSECIVRIYSVSGVLVNVLTHNDPTGGGLLNWNLRNRNNQFVASGVYFYHIEAPDGKTKVGRFTVVNFAP